MAGRKTSRLRMRSKIAERIMDGELLTQAQWEWLRKENDHLADTAFKSPEEMHRRKKAYHESRVEGRKKAELERMHQLTHKALDVFESSLDEYLDAVERMHDAEEPEVVEQARKEAALARKDALKAAQRVEDRKFGQAKQTIEGHVKHEHSVLERMHEANALEFQPQEFIEGEVIRESIEEGESGE